jgi:hypothetical protein
MFESFMASIMGGLQEWLTGSIVTFITSFLTGMFSGS